MGISHPDVRQQTRALVLGTDLSAEKDAKSRVHDGQPLNLDKGMISDAEAILGANHSVLDIARCVTPRGTTQHANGSHWFDPSAPTPQEMQRQQEVRSLCKSLFVFPLSPFSDFFENPFTEV